MTSVTELYQQTLAERGYQADPAQLRAVAALQRCQDEWGRLQGAPLQRVQQAAGRAADTQDPAALPRVMREVHRELQELKGIQDPLEELGKRIARRFR
ncbi:hypothetical protein Ddc_24929 [Ditylenchus destructor]|nr:hypothetical protein Ddc_24929 [Ditylenchus destructor]